MERALYRLALDGDTLTPRASENGHAFDVHAYSRFKYGDGEVANYYATELATMLEYRADINPDEKLWISGSAYYRTPTAAVAIATTLTKRLQSRGFATSYFRLQAPPYAGDYGTMSTAARTAFLSKHHLSVATSMYKQLPQSKVIIVDDIRITGSHEAVLRSFLTRAGVEKALFCYVAVLDQQDAARYPEVEDQLNHAYVTDLTKLTEIVHRARFQPNARLCKYILNADTPVLTRFVRTTSPNQLKTLLEHMRADGYNQRSTYRNSFLRLQALARGRIRRRYKSDVIYTI